MSFKTKGRAVLSEAAALLREEAPTLLGVAGAGAALYGVARLSPPAAWIVGGLAALVAAVAWAQTENR